MQAFRSEYLPPTDSKGGRIKVNCSAGSRVYPYDHSLNAPQAHRAAAVEFATELDWLVGGLRLESGYWRNGYVHVLVVN
jgi:hypothetical protein